MQTLCFSRVSILTWLWTHQGCVKVIFTALLDMWCDDVGSARCTSRFDQLFSPKLNWTKQDSTDTLLIGSWQQHSTLSSKSLWPCMQTLRHYVYLHQSRRLNLWRKDVLQIHQSTLGLSVWVVWMNRSSRACPGNLAPGLASVPGHGHQVGAVRF